MSRINPNSSIRSGYRFEDIYTLKLCVDWLKEPEIYRELRIQYVPDEVEGHRFAIDDIVLISKDGHYIFHQLKYKQHPETDLWDTQELMKKGLVKWISSFINSSKSLIQAGLFVTNGLPAPEIEFCLEGNHISLSKLAEVNSKCVAELIDLFGIDSLNYFFSNFLFIFSYTDLKTFEAGVRATLYNDLKATKDGVNNLLLHIMNEGSVPYPAALTLPEIRHLLAWDNPRPLNQGFDIPSDFEFFDKGSHEHLVAKLLKSEGGIQVLIGKPGSGKSTYLSKLYELLSKKLGVSVARHHYHLNPKDSSFRERLNSDRVKEALRAEFKKENKEVLGELSYQNTEHTPLRDFITRLSKYYLERGRCFVLIIDGLDHVIRESKRENELRDFLEDILYPQPGFFILFGTQEMAVPYFPNVIHRYCPKENWIEVKGLRKPAVDRIILKNGKELALPKNRDLYQSICNKVFTKTKGNPLHLRYVLNQLKDVGDIFKDDIEYILPYKSEIKEYYQDLWRQLPNVAKSMCFSIAVLDFKLYEEELLELATYFVSYPAEIHSSYTNIKHLIKTDLFGISVYHNSFSVFLLNHEDLVVQKKAIYLQLRKWLKKSGNADLRWSELAKIEYYLGNSKPILSLDRKWVIDSFLACYPDEQIENLLSLASEAAFLNRDYAKVVFFKTLEVYFSNKRFSLRDTLDKIWIISFSYKHDLIRRYPQFDKFNHVQIREILLSLKETGKVHVIPEEVTDKFGELFSDRNSEMQEVVENWVQIIASFQSETVLRAYKFIIQGRQNNASAHYFAIYASHLIDQSLKDRVLKLLKQDLLPEEKKSIVKVLIDDDLRNGKFEWKKHIKRNIYNPLNSNWQQLYFILSGEAYQQNGKLAGYDSFPTKVQLHSIREEEMLYVDNFFKGFFTCTSGALSGVIDWINNASSQWSVQLMAKGLAASTYLGTCLTERKRCSVSKLVSYYRDLPTIDFYDDHDIFELRRSVLPTLIRLSLELLTIINIHNKFRPDLSTKECVDLIDCKWLYRDDLKSLLTSKKIILSDKAFDEFKKREILDFSAKIIPFKDRAERLSNLSSLAKLLGKHKAAIELNRQAAENIIAYGHHKDMTLYSIMRSIEICCDNGSKKAKKYLRDIAKYVYHIEDLTDGDETSSFIYNYGSLLAKSDPNLLYNLYLDAVEQRQYNLAEILFGDTLSALNFETLLAQAIGGTAVDQNAFNSLSFVAKSNRGARQILRQIRSVFGFVDYSTDKGDAYTPSDKEEQAEPELYNSIPPENLKTYLQNIHGKNYYHRKHVLSDFIISWSKHWFRNKSKLSLIIKCLQEVVLIHAEDLSHKVFDHIYSFALKVDREFAFRCIVHAHANNSSWSEEYIQRMESSRERWLRVIRDFPKRALEFFESSIQLSGKYYGTSNVSYFIPIPKATQFFIDLGNIKMAEKVTEDYIKILPLLFPEIELVDPDFLRNERPIGEFQLLMSRFNSMSPLVRERAGWHIANLLRQDLSGEFHALFLQSISKTILETHICNSLLVLIKSLQYKDSLSYKHLDISRVVDNLPTVCQAIEVLLERISGLLKQPLNIELPFVLTISSLNPEMTMEKFFKKIGTYLPLTYQDYLQDLERKASMPLWNIWCNMYLETCRKLKLEDTHTDQDYANSKREYMIGRSTIFSEVLRSSYFKLLDFLSELWQIDPTDSVYYMTRNFPVDPSIWQLSLSRRPEWWPQFLEDSKDIGDGRTGRLRKPIADVFLHEINGHVLHFSGAIRAVQNHYESTLEGTVHVVPFGYRKLGDSLPDARAVYEILEQSSGVWYPWVVNRSNVGLFDNELRFHEREQASSLPDIDLVPLVSEVSLLNSHMWQYYRWRYHFSLLHPLLAQDIHLDITNGSIKYVKKRKRIAQTFDFADGIRDRSQYQRVIPAGNYIIIDREFLRAFLEAHQLKMGYVIRQRHSAREYSFSDEAKKVVFYELIWDVI